MATASAGYEYQPRKYVLKFEDYPGLEVAARGVSVGELLKVLELAEAMMTAPGAEQVEEMFRIFARHLIGWNLTENGKAVPGTAEALMSKDMEFSTAIVMGWVKAVSPGKSPAPGGTDQAQMEASIPMSPVTAAGM